MQEQMDRDMDGWCDRRKHRETGYEHREMVTVTGTGIGTVTEGQEWDG